MNEKLDCVVIGAGVVGLAIARALAQAGRDVVVLEAEPQIGMHASSRNSEVIHAGLYYAEDTLKARLCVRGKELLYEFCAANGIAHRRVGKLIVASDSADLDTLGLIEAQAMANGVTDLRFLSKEDVHRFEPGVSCIGALLSPSTGIVDSHTLMLSLQAAIEESRGSVVLGSSVSNLHMTNGGIAFETAGQGYSCETLINSAGLWAQDLVASFATDSKWRASLPKTWLAKGHYFSYRGRSPFRHLVYPVPAEGGLGIHATNDLGGHARFGPDVTWVDEVDYAFDDTRKPEIVAAIERYFPQVDSDRLEPAYTGIRPRLHGPGEPAADFMIVGESNHGIPGLVHLCGIESPGLTASLAIGEYVATLIENC